MVAMAIVHYCLAVLSLTFTEVCLVIIWLVGCVSIIWVMRLIHDQYMEDLHRHRLHQKELTQKIRSEREAWLKSMR